MKEFFEYLRKLGGLHDAVMTDLRWKPAERTIELHFDDLFSNFEGLPEYPGRQPAVIVLHGVSDVRVDIETSDSTLRVFEFLAREGSSDAVTLTFSPSGKLESRLQSADYPPWPLPTGG